MSARASKAFAVPLRGIAAKAAGTALLCAVVGCAALAVHAAVPAGAESAAGADSAIPYALQTQPPYTVALDAGHGGMDSGAQTRVDEVTVCEATVDALYTLLAADENYVPVRTRPNGEDRSTADRAAAAAAAQASLLLSVHANCDDDSHQSHGFECFPTPPGRTYAAQSLRFAQCIALRMEAAGHRLRGGNGVRYAYYSGSRKTLVEASDQRVRARKSFGMVEKPLCPAVLAEQCFLSNGADLEAWASAAGCRRAARVYYEAICAYFGTVPRSDAAPAAPSMPAAQAALAVP